MAELDQIKKVTGELSNALDNTKKLLDTVEKSLNKVLNDKQIAEMEITRIKEKGFEEAAAIRKQKEAFDGYRAKEMEDITSARRALEAKEFEISKQSKEIDSLKIVLERYKQNAEVEAKRLSELKAEYESKLTGMREFISRSQ